MNQDEKNNNLKNTSTSSLSNGLRGEISAPGDKSISHRCVILSSIAIGESRIEGLLGSTDVICTIEAMKSLGANISLNSNKCIINGIGIGSLIEPKKPLDFGNSGTAARLIMGLVSTHPIKSVFVGDASLSKRPMGRVIDPLTEFGTEFELTSSEFFPIVVNGAKLPIPISYETSVPSAQVKSAVLLAGLNTPGVTSVIEKQKTRDHTERLLEIYGYQIDIIEEKQKTKISITGQESLTSVNIVVPGDPSSAAYPVVAGLICKNSNVTVKNVLMNPTRDGIYKSLEEMGAKIDFTNKKFQAGEDVYDILVESSHLKAIDVPASRAPSMIDDYPVLAVAASIAEGTSIFRGLSELKVKESNRLSGIKHFLEVNGVNVAIKNDDLIIEGNPKGIKGGGIINTNLDHRIAMSSLILGLISDSPVSIDDTKTIDTSFPGFINLMRALGAKIKLSDMSSAL
ncbi:MAG: 3-phosphoshikimate 1-carboxyvinyltransferase [alpha proteobacterium MED-G09]|nr:3-phosphoshikimate 1-carboxyvinyltransferase [Rhodobiaceae bacterium]PDH50557.1 MAG: 3-phosphoshikimate 1-carboxyvinyltransferase [alpha proteobacterium MED-G09]